MKAQRGMVLVIVLWIVTLLAVMAAGFAYSMRTETQLATSSVERAQARALAEAGAVYALAWQLDPEAQKAWAANGDTRAWEFGGGQMQIRVEEASGRVNINQADPALLQRLLEGIGVEAAEAERLALAIVESRNQAGYAPNNAADSAQQNAPSFKPKHAPFDSVAELQQIPGMTRAMVQRLMPLTTTEGWVAWVDSRLASLPVLQVLTGLDEQTLLAYIQARGAIEEGAALPTLPDNPASQFFSTGMSGIYHIAVTAQAGEGATVTTQSIASTQNLPPGQIVRWLSWRFGY